MLIKLMQYKQPKKWKSGNVIFSCESKEDAYSQKIKIIFLSKKHLQEINF